MPDNFDINFMRQALAMADRAEQLGEVPVGAVICLDNTIIAQGWNSPISSCDPTAHAEIIAMRNAAHYLNNYRIVNTTLYVTLEPCPMCIGAMLQARVKRLVFGAMDSRSGCVGSVINLLEQSSFNHKINYTSGVLNEICAEKIQGFFRKKRQ